mmetsp:Transcript_187/g.321  ORF Transcript_187/g.321 Transcript_187/m.321 type:complete len:430 (+) Transcript_187:22-1311(+)
MEPYVDEEGDELMLKTPHIVVSPSKPEHPLNTKDIRFDILTDNFGNSGVKQIMCMITLVNSYTVTWLSNSPHIKDYPDHTKDYILKASQTDPNIGLIYLEEPYELKFVFIKSLKRFVPPRIVFATPNHIIVKDRVVDINQNEFVGAEDDHAFELKYIDHHLKKKSFTSSFDHFKSIFKANDQLRAMNEKLMLSIKGHLNDTKHLDGMVTQMEHENERKKRSVDSYKTQIVHLQKTIAILKANHKKECAKYEEAHVDVEEQLGITQRELINVRSDYAAMEKEITYLRSQTSSQVNSMLEATRSQSIKYKGRVQELTERLEMAREAAAQDFSNQLLKERQRFENHIEKINANHAAALLSERSKIKELLEQKEVDLKKQFEAEKLQLSIDNRKYQRDLIRKFENELETQKQMWDEERKRFHDIIDRTKREAS